MVGDAEHSSRGKGESRSGTSPGSPPCQAAHATLRSPGAYGCSWDGTIHSIHPISPSRHLSLCDTSNDSKVCVQFRSLWSVARKLNCLEDGNATKARNPESQPLSSPHTRLPCLILSQHPTAGPPVTPPLNSLYYQTVQWSRNIGVSVIRQRILTPTVPLWSSAPRIIT